jgi:transposase
MNIKTSCKGQIRTLSISTSKVYPKTPQRVKIVFWPDLASAHYTKDTLPPNISQLRSIENFWAILKRKVFSKNYCSKNVKFLMAKIRKERGFVRP